MFRTLQPTYTFRVVIEDKYPPPSPALTQPSTVLPPGSAIFGFNGLSGKTGCDEAVAAVKKALKDAGLQAEVFFERFELK